MSGQQAQIFLGARIPSGLKEMLSSYCLGHGIKMNHLVAEAIKEKLLDLAEETHDIAMARTRLKDAVFLSPMAFGKYLRKRGIKP